MVSINLALLKRQLNKKTKERWFSHCWEAFKMTKSFIYKILLESEMPFNLDRKKIPTFLKNFLKNSKKITSCWSVLNVDTLTLFSRGITSNTFLIETTESLLLQKRQEAATGGFL